MWKISHKFKEWRKEARKLDTQPQTVKVLTITSHKTEIGVGLSMKDTEPYKITNYSLSKWKKKISTKSPI